MNVTIQELTKRVESHRCFSHPIFKNWAKINPEPAVVGALFHQIQSFCESTRPGWNFPDALKEHGLSRQSELLEEIVESESGHGPELATMAGYIVNRASQTPLFLDLYDQAQVEAKLKEFSNKLLGSLPGYETKTGLTMPVRKAIGVFERRKLTDIENTYRNLGTTLALEMISNQQLIPGEKHCLIDSGNYRTTLDAPEMHYLFEHWGELGAEQHHEENARKAVELALQTEYAHLVIEGLDDFLNSLTGLWDVLDAALLHSGVKEKEAAYA
jgi:hypothetical protein